MTTGTADILGRFQAINQDSSLPRIGEGMEQKQLEEVAKEFEAIFVKQMLDTMKSTLNKENRLVEGGMAENIFEDMLYTEYSRLMSKSGDFGIADMIVRQYSQNRGGADPAIAAASYRSNS
jgi:flagellar protein FlgJ